MNSDEENKHTITVRRKVTSDQIVKQNRNNQGMIQEGIMVMITRENLSTVNVIIAEEKVIDNSNVESGSTI